jgi:NET1-associated nuclear protein 1 (U3 small nucleolar RNA-associated protein 17)
MADANATPQLKRKGEEVAAQRKTKKQRKSDAAALRNGNGVETAITATNTTPNAKNTSTPKKQSQVTPQTNGTPSTSQQNGLVDLADQQDATPHLLKASGDEESRKTKKKEKKERKERDKQKRNNELSIEESIAATKGKDNWVTSPVQGGWFQSTDPVFSPDEKYLILANLRSLRIYATETSLLAKTLPVDEGVLTAYALSSKPSQVYIADSAGCIALWDWVSGKNLARWYLRSTVEHMAVITKPDSDDELLCCVDGKDISVRALSIKAKPDEPRHSLKQILETGFTIRGLQVLLQGKYIIVSSDESITVGKRVKVSKTELQDFEYVWREFKFSKRVTTFNAYHREPQETGKGKKVDQRDVIDIAVGDDTGVILLFEDILASFATVEKSKKDKVNNAEGLRPKRLHWHRDAVGAVKWSLDGKSNLSPLSVALLILRRQLCCFWRQ